MGENERKLTLNLLMSSLESERSWRTRDLTSESWRPAVKKTKLTSPESCPCSNWEGDSKETSAARQLDTKAHAGSLSGHANEGRRRAQLFGCGGDLAGDEGE